MPPRKYRVLARLYFYLEHIRLLSQMRMLIALSNRIQAIMAVRPYQELDKVALVDGKGEPFQFMPSLLHDKSTLLEQRIIGKAFPISKDEYAFYGFDIEVFSMIADQDFNRISEFRSALTGVKSIEDYFLLDERDLAKYGLEPEARWQKAGGTWWWVRLAGKLVVTGSGRATAFLRKSEA